MASRSNCLLFPSSSLPPGILCRVAEVDFSKDTTNVIEMFDEVKNTDPEVLTLTYVSFWIISPLTNYNSFLGKILS